MPPLPPRKAPPTSPKIGKGKSKIFLKVGPYYRVFLGVIAHLTQLAHVRQFAQSIQIAQSAQIAEIAYFNIERIAKIIAERC